MFVNSTLKLRHATILLMGILTMCAIGGNGDTFKAITITAFIAGLSAILAEELNHNLVMSRLLSLKLSEILKKEVDHILFTIKDRRKQSFRCITLFILTMIGLSTYLKINEIGYNSFFVTLIVISSLFILGNIILQLVTDYRSIKELESNY